MSTKYREACEVCKDSLKVVSTKYPGRIDKAAFGQCIHRLSIVFVLTWTHRLEPCDRKLSSRADE